ncbi:MAG: hypothetical protein U0L55_06775, partial [Acutalibacteraceae bacterium]|nr:hypothetical protein [Acutalibacteraceae bacterium]
MKKFLAILFSVVILATFMAMPAFAAKSPEGELVHKVTFTSYASGKGEASNYKVDGDTIIFTSSDSEYAFKGWIINGVEGVDYEIVSGDLNSETLVIRPLSSVDVKEVFDVPGLVLDEEGNVVDDGNKNDSDKAPQTGNGMLAVVSLLTAGAFTAMIVTRKSARA